MHNNELLIRRLVKAGRLRSPEIIAAFRAIDRKDFVGTGKENCAYEDHALAIGYNATISQPTTVAFMLEKLAAEPGDKVLDIGSGSGWTTALLAKIVGETGQVYGIEIVPALVEFGSSNLRKYCITNATIIQAEQGLGLPAKAPFNKILVSAGIERLPNELLVQLKVNGTLVIPVEDAIWQVNKITDNQSNVQKYPGFIFVPLQYPQY